MVSENQENPNVEADRNNVVDFGARLTATAKAQDKPLFFTDAERAEIREMLAYYRISRPQFEAMKRGCPTARYLLDED